MRAERTYLDYLEDIQDAIEKVALFIVSMSEAEFIQDDKTVFAVIRALEILGEAAKQIPADVRLQYPDVPWKEMAQMRDILIHHYYGSVVTFYDTPMKIHKLAKHLQKDRPMTMVSIRIPDDVLKDLKRVAPLLGFSGYQALSKAYCSPS